jgi:four helix bundle protein
MSNPTFPFPHTRLDVFRVALQMAAKAKPLADRVPRGYRSFADHLIRAAGNTVLLIGEGANLYSVGAKRQRYSEARGEAGEVAAAVELLSTLALVPAKEADEVLELAGRVGAMLTRLLQRLG